MWLYSFDYYQPFYLFWFKISWHPVSVIETVRLSRCKEIWNIVSCHFLVNFLGFWFQVMQVISLCSWRHRKNFSKTRFQFVFNNRLNFWTTVLTIASPFFSVSLVPMLEVPRMASVRFAHKEFKGQFSCLETCKSDDSLCRSWHGAQFRIACCFFLTDSGRDSYFAIPKYWINCFLSPFLLLCL